MKKLIAFLTLLLTTLVSVSATPLYAAEINPEAGTYSYGSTSELTPYQDVVYVPPSDEQLAPTGTNTFMIYLLAISLIGLGAAVIAKTSRSEL